jgi:hypothetical protein
MRKVYRRRMEKLGLLPNVTPLSVLVFAPRYVRELWIDPRRELRKAAYPSA